MRAVGEADRGRGAGNLLHRHDMGEIAHARAAAIRIGRDAEQAEAAQFPPQMHREFVVAVDRSGQRRYLLLREAPHHVAQRLDLLVVPELQRAVVHGRSPEWYRRRLGASSW